MGYDRVSMDLNLNMAVAEGYSSPSQIARRVSEYWASVNLYCLACTSKHLDAAKANTAVWDYSCYDLWSLVSTQGKERTVWSESSKFPIAMPKCGP